MADSLHGRRWLLGAVGTALLALGMTSQARATIVYQHGSDIWMMNDNGTGARALASSAHFPGLGPWKLGDPDVLPGASTVVFSATTSAYDDGPANGPPGGCGLECTGTYRLHAGVLTRLSPNPSRCGASQQWCTSFETTPRVSAGGLVLYDYFLTAWDYSCLELPCTWEFSDSVHEVDSRSLATGGSEAKWRGSSVSGQQLSTDALPAPDPADGSLVAYAENVPCTAQGCAYDVHVGNQQGSVDRVVVYDDGPFNSLAWLPDGSGLIDVESGTEPGIWAYNAATTTTAKNFIWVLADPAGYNANDPYSTSIDQARYMGPDKVLFSQDNDLYTIPLTTCAQKATSTSAGCTMADAHRLTTGGTSRAPVWTKASMSSLLGSHTLTVKRSGSGGGSVKSSPVGISCGKTCSHAFATGTAVTLTAAPASGSTFAHWSVSSCGKAEHCRVTITANRTVTATFKH